MQLEINKCILLFFGWFIQASKWKGEFIYFKNSWFFGGLELSCIQCTSPIRRISQNWDHSCLDASLVPIPCELSSNASKSTFINCASALYRLGYKGSKGKKNVLVI